MISDIPYLAPNRTESLDLYEPADASEAARPAIVIIHGGGWRGGDKADAREKQMAEILTAAGYVCVSINYKLFTDAEPAWPTYLDDARAAVRWLRRNAAKHRIDPTRIGAIGGSAGGNIALMLGLPAGGDVPGNVSAVVALYPPTDMGWAGARRAKLFGVSEADVPRVAREASPLFTVTKSFPPTLLIHGTEDKLVSLEHSELLAARFAELGVEHRLIVVQGAPHTHKLQDEHADVRADVVGFFDKHLKHG